MVKNSVVMETDDGFTTSDAEMDSDDDDAESEVELCMFLDQAATIQKALLKGGRGKGIVLKPREPTVGGPPTVLSPQPLSDSGHTTPTNKHVANGTAEVPMTTSSGAPGGGDGHDLDSILGALSALECQLDDEQQNVSQATLKRRRQPQSSPALTRRQQSLSLPPAPAPPPSSASSDPPLSSPSAARNAEEDEGLSSLLASLEISSPSPADSSSHSNDHQRHHSLVLDDKPLPPPPAFMEDAPTAASTTLTLTSSSTSDMRPKWGDSLDDQLQEALAELTNFSPVLNTSSSSSSSGTATSFVAGSTKTPKPAPPPVAPKQRLSLLTAQQNSGADNVDSGQQISPATKSCLKSSSQRSPSAACTAASEEQAGKAEMMQRFIDVAMRQSQGQGHGSPEADSGAYCDDMSLSSRASVLTACSQSSLASSSGSGGGHGVGGSSTLSGDTLVTGQSERSVRFSSERPSLLVDPKDTAKVPVKVQLPDGSQRVLQVNALMTVAQVLDTVQLAQGLAPSLGWALVEMTPELYMERLLEDHEYVLETLSFWSRDSENRLVFMDKPLKYDLFLHPEMYLLKEGEKGVMSHDRAAQKSLIEDFFTEGSQAVPEVEGMLYIKSEGKKAWKKLYFVLRASGIYYNPKGKGKTSKDLVCLQTFDVVDVYVGVAWKKKYKAPTTYCFALKNAQIQKKAPKYIKYLCAEDHKTFSQWVMGIRIAKTGRQMLENYRSAQESMASWSTATLDTRGAARKSSASTSALKSSAAAAAAAAAARSSAEAAALGGHMGRTVSMPHVQHLPGHGRMSSLSVAGGGIGVNLDYGGSSDAMLGAGATAAAAAARNGIGGHSVRVSSFSHPNSSRLSDEFADGANGGADPQYLRHQHVAKPVLARSESCVLHGGDRNGSQGIWRPHPSPSPSLRSVGHCSGITRPLTVDTSFDPDFPPPPSPGTLSNSGVGGSGIAMGVRPQTTAIIRRPSSSSSSLSLASRASTDTSLRQQVSPSASASHQRLSSSSSFGGILTSSPHTPDVFVAVSHELALTANYSDPANQRGGSVVPANSGHTQGLGQGQQGGQLHSFYGPPSPGGVGGLDRTSSSSKSALKRTPSLTGTPAFRERLSSASSTRSMFNEDLELALSKKSASWRPEDDIVDGGKNVNAALLAPALMPSSAIGGNARPVMGRSLSNGRHSSSSSGGGGVGSMPATPLMGLSSTSSSSRTSRSAVVPTPLKASPSLDVNANAASPTSDGTGTLKASDWRSSRQSSTNGPKPAPPPLAPKPTLVPGAPVVPAEEVITIIPGDVNGESRKKAPPPLPKRNQETRLTSFQ